MNLSKIEGEATVADYDPPVVTSNLRIEVLEVWGAGNSGLTSVQAWTKEEWL